MLIALIDAFAAMAGARPLKSAFVSLRSGDHSMAFCASPIDGTAQRAARRHVAILIGIGYLHMRFIRDIFADARRGSPAGHFVRVLPDQDSRGRADAARKDDSGAGAAAAGLLLGHLRRRRQHARQDARRSSTASSASTAHGDGAPDVRERHAREIRRACSRKRAALGITNILALRGDPPDGSAISTTDGRLRVLLPAGARSSRTGGFSIGVAGFPGRSHRLHRRQARRLEAPEAQDRSGRRLRHHAALLQQPRLLRVPRLSDVARRDACRSFPAFCRSSARARSSGSSRCAARICRATLVRELDDVGDDDEAVTQFGIEYATRQCEELLREGAPGLHFYTLNKARSTSQIVENLNLAKSTR